MDGSTAVVLVDVAFVVKAAVIHRVLFQFFRMFIMIWPSCATWSTRDYCGPSSIDIIALRAVSDDWTTTELTTEDGIFVVVVVVVDDADTTFADLLLLPLLKLYWKILRSWRSTTCVWSRRRKTVASVGGATESVPCQS